MDSPNWQEQNLPWRPASRAGRAHLLDVARSFRPHSETSRRRKREEGDSHSYQTRSGQRHRRRNKKKPKGRATLRTITPPNRTNSTKTSFSLHKSQASKLLLPPPPPYTLLDSRGSRRCGRDDLLLWRRARLLRLWLVAILPGGLALLRRRLLFRSYGRRLSPGPGRLSVVVVAQRVVGVGGGEEREAV